MESFLSRLKKGSAGRAQVTLNISGGFSNAAVDFRPTLNGDQRRELLYEGLVNYAIDQNMESPTAYADQEIGQYAYVPSMGVYRLAERIVTNSYSAGL